MIATRTVGLSLVAAGIVLVVLTLWYERRGRRHEEGYAAVIAEVGAMLNPGYVPSVLLVLVGLLLYAGPVAFEVPDVLASPSPPATPSP